MSNLICTGRGFRIHVVFVKKELGQIQYCVRYVKSGFIRGVVG